MGFGRGVGFTPEGAPPQRITILATIDESGHLNRTQEETWAGCHDAALATGGYEALEVTQLSSWWNPTSKFNCDRGRIRFDTSVLPDNAVIDKAVFAIKLYTAIEQHYGTCHVCLVSGEGLGDDMALADYEVILGNTTLIAPQVDVEDLVAGSFQKFELIGDYHDLIILDGYTILCLRTSFDREDDPVINYVKEILLKFFCGSVTTPDSSRARLTIDYHT